MHVNLKVPTQIKKAIQAIAHDNYHDYKLSMDKFMGDKKQGDKSKFMLHTLIYIALYAKEHKYVSLLKSYPGMDDFFEPATDKIKSAVYASLPSRKPKAQAITQLNQDYALLTDVQIKSLKSYFPAKTVNEFLDSSVQHYIAGKHLSWYQKPQTEQSEKDQYAKIAIHEAIYYLDKHLDLKTDNNSHFKKLVGDDTKSKILCDLLFSHLEEQHNYSTSRARMSLNEADFINTFKNLKLSSKFLVAHFNEYVPRLNFSPHLVTTYLDAVNFEDLLLTGGFTLGRGANYDDFIQYCVDKNWTIERFFNPEKNIEMIAFPTYQEEHLKTLFSTHKDKQLLDMTLGTLTNAANADTAPSPDIERVKKISKI